MSSTHRSFAALALLLVSSHCLCLASNVSSAQSPSSVAASQQAAISSQSSASKQASPVVAGNSQDGINQARQGRSAQGGQSGVSNASAASNNIETSKYRFEQDRKQLMEFFTAKNVLKNLIKLLWGNPEEMNATSRQVLGVLNKVLDMLKSTFGHKARSASGRGLRDHVDDVASASVTMLQGYVKAVMAPEDKCAQRYLCQASREAVATNRDIGYFVSQVAGYATSYLLDGQKLGPFQANFDATRHGRMLQDCDKLYHECHDEH